jgi:HTH-type transcriptional regulator, sugar sensing transcriptional regulator
MQVDLVNRLSEFGFTVNQAKVYLDIVQSGSTSVGQISKNTMLHRQDIYKLLPKLEKMGLITRTIGKPVIIEALPAEKALERIISIEKEAVDRKIARLEKALMELAQEIKHQPKLASETRFTLLTTSAALKSRIASTFKVKPVAFRVVSTTENLKGQAGHFYKQYFQVVADSGIKIHLILVGSENPVDLKRLVEKITPRNGYLTTKALERCASKDYQVVDDSEVWIATQQKTSEGYPAILWTNDVNMVESYLENFNEAWNNPKAVPLLEGPDRQIETIKAVST